MIPNYYKMIGRVAELVKNGQLIRSPIESPMLKSEESPWYIAWIGSMTSSLKKR